MKENFLWGGAAAAHQLEGGLNKSSKGLSVSDVLTVGGVNKFRKITDGVLENEYYPNHEAVDFYSHYKEDIALMGEMGFKCFRTSFDWSRIFPNGDDEYPDEEGLKFYDSVLDELEKYHITPVITLSHFELPLNLAKKYGGWRNKELINLFVKYAKVCFNRYHNRVKLWLTFNEINNQIQIDNPFFTWTNSGVVYKDIPNKEEVLYQVIHNQFVASALAVKAAHEIDNSLKVGCMIAAEAFYPYSCHPDDMMKSIELMHNVLFFSDVQVRGFYPGYAKKMFERKGYDLLMEENDEQILKEGKVDFIALSYYFSHSVSHDETLDQDDPIKEKNKYLVSNPYLTKTDWGWQIDPVGLRYILNVFYERYATPLFVVENGLGAQDTLEEDGTIHDEYRIDFFKKHITELKKAIDIDGVDVLGYTTWAAIDIISAGSGEMKKRYGFIYVDRNNDGTGSYKRYKKDSFYWYKKVIASNGEDL